MRNKDFTLIEFLVVVAITCILGASTMVVYNEYKNSVRVKVVKQNHIRAVKFIQSEMLKAATSGMVSKWDRNNKKCVQVNANIDWRKNGEWAYQCLSERLEFDQSTKQTGKNTNPFNNNEKAFWGDLINYIPSISPNRSGRTNCVFDLATQQFQCFSRWGLSKPNFESAYINSPYVKRHALN